LGLKLRKLEAEIRRPDRRDGPLRWRLGSRHERCAPAASLRGRNRDRRAGRLPV